MNTKNDILRNMAKSIEYRSRIVKISCSDLPEKERTKVLCDFLKCTPELAHEIVSMPLVELLDLMGHYEEEPRFANL